MDGFLEASISAASPGGHLMSSGKFPDPKVTRAFRRAFIDLWAEFLHNNYTSTAHVAVVFGVDESTARSWWNRITAPSGFAVAMAFRDRPGEAARALFGGCLRRLIGPSPSLHWLRRDA
jgi:hypothetical protein